MSVYLYKGRWKIDITLGGARINRGIPARSKKEALAIQEEMKVLYRRGQLGLALDEERLDKPFAAYAEDYLSHVQGTLQARTYELYNGDYEVHLKNFWDDIIIPGGLSNDIILEFQKRQKKAGLSNCTVNKHVGLVRKILYFARDKDESLVLPRLKFPMLEEPIHQHAFLAPDEFAALIEAFSAQPQAYKSLLRTRLGRLTGMRPAELTWLEWDDINLTLETVKIQGKKGWEPKNLKERTIPLTKEALGILRELYNRRTGPRVFGGVKSIRKALQTAARNAGITKRVTPNMMRHTFATHLLMHGADVKAVQELLGHSNLETTTRYTHAISGHLRKAVNKLSPAKNPAKVPLQAARCRQIKTSLKTKKSLSSGRL